VRVAAPVVFTRDVLKPLLAEGARDRFLLAISGAAQQACSKAIIRPQDQAAFRREAPA
jgi:hypothetical protein